MSKVARQKKSVPSFLWENYRTMSYDVGRKVPIFRETACMSPLEREIYGCLEAFKIFIGENPSSEKLQKFIKVIDRKLKPMVQKMGQAQWLRDVVTDLGFAKAMFYTPRSAKLDGVLSFEPSQDE